MESQVFGISSSFIHTALVSRIFLGVFSCYNLKMSQRPECTMSLRHLHSLLYILVWRFPKDLNLEKFVKPEQYEWKLKMPKDLRFLTGLLRKIDWPSLFFSVKLYKKKSHALKAECLYWPGQAIDSLLGTNLDTWTPLLMIWQKGPGWPCPVSAALKKPSWYCKKSCSGEFLASNQGKNRDQNSKRLFQAFKPLIYIPWGPSWC